MSAGTRTLRLTAVKWAILGSIFLMPAYALAQLDQLPSGPITDRTASRVTGEVLKIEGEYYVIRDDFDKEVRLQVSPSTEIKGDTPKVGDTIEAEVAEGGHATMLQVTTGGEAGH